MNSANEKQRTILGIYAHPDDEILGSGATLAHYANDGVHVALVMATRGEAGEIQRPGTATPETLPHVRVREMECSATSLGVADLIWLGYRDSGMEGSEGNEHPEAFINAPAEEVVGRLVRIIRRLRPDVVLTFEPYGGYGHPDHIAANRHTLAAFNAAGDPEQYPEAGAPWRPGRLFYPVIPTRTLREMRQRMVAHDIDPGRMDDLINNRRKMGGWPDNEIHATLDVSATIENKWKAWNCHRTQFGPNSRFRQLPEAEMKEILSTEYFAMARPAPTPGLTLDDLFGEIEGEGR
ncbi:MAG: PIG-L family deacetylase [Candidatus Promineifilaceae bacterium]|nr:PIG-L family deacetylase [Candidatus Promineifilaceae bacterium]